MYFDFMPLIPIGIIIGVGFTLVFWGVIELVLFIKEI